MLLFISSPLSATVGEKSSGFTRSTRCARHAKRERTALPHTGKSLVNCTAAKQVDALDPSEAIKTLAAIKKTGTIIVPGKFDAFHLGHRELARVAAEIGNPTLMSFSGMAEALKWSPRAPVVAAIERDRILRSWSGAVGKHIGWKVLPFNEIRDQSPEEFLDLLVSQYDAAGIVCGRDWRFGRRAVGDVALLRRLAAARDLPVHVVDAVDLGGAGGVISSTRVREALAVADVALAARLLGRPHRLVGYVSALGERWVDCHKFVNQVPGDGSFVARVRVIGASEPLRVAVTVQRPSSADPMTPVAMLDDPDAVLVRIHDAEQIYCQECEVYMDFLERVP